MSGFGSTPFGNAPFGGAYRFGGTTKIIDRALRVTGQATDDSDAREISLDFLNMRYNQFLSGKKWKFLQRSLTMDLMPPYSVGTIRVTQGSDIITENIDPNSNPVAEPLTFNSNMIGQTFISRDSESTSYTIIGVPNEKSLQLSSAYSGESAEFIHYKILFDNYHVDERVGKIGSALLGGSYGRNPELALIGRQELRQLQKRSLFQESIPQYMSLDEFDSDGSGRKKFNIWPAPDKRYTLQLDYEVQVTALVDEEGNYPLIPEEYTSALFFALCADLYKNQNNTAMAQSYGSDASVAFSKMAGDYDMTDNKARIMMKTKYYGKPVARSKRHSSIQYAGLDYFGSFD